MNLTRLNEILAVDDRYNRGQQLLRYAQALGIKIDQIRLRDGGYNEEKLTVLIFDELKREERKGKSVFSWTAVGTAVAAGLLLMTLIVPGIIYRFYIKEKKKPPAEYRLMDGVYEQYDDQGRVVYEYKYEHGRLISRKEFDRQGKAVGTDVFNHSDREQ